MVVAYLILFLAVAALIGAALGLATVATLRAFNARSYLAHGALGAVYGLMLAFALSAAFDVLGTAQNDDDVEVEMPIFACVSLGMVSSLLVRLSRR